MIIKTSKRIDGPMNLPGNDGYNLRIFTNKHKMEGLTEADVVKVSHTKDDFLVGKDKPVAIPFADCHPVFVYHEPTKRVVGIHTGWKAALDGVIHNAVKWIKWPNDIKVGELKAWIGPGLSLESFQIHMDVAQEFPHFAKYGNAEIHLDMIGFLRSELAKEGIDDIYVTNEDTLNSDYFSYRTDKRVPVYNNIAILDWNS